MDDIVPDLIESITRDFREAYKKSAKIQRLLEQVRAGTATYAQVHAYSIEVSRLIGTTYEKHISSAALPDGRMYYNIASRVIPSSLDENYRLVSSYAQSVQKSLNDRANIGIRPQVPEKNQDRIDGLVDFASNAEQYDQVSDKLRAAMENFSQNIVDEAVRKNAEVQYRSGLRPKIVRRAERKCCPWCAALAGEYDYPDVPDDVYRRHENCRCVVEYDPGDGRRENVHTKRWTTSGERDTIEERKRIGLDGIDTFRANDLADTIRRYVQVEREKVVEAAKAGKRHGHTGVYMDAQKKSKKQLQRSIISHTARVERHADKLDHPENYVEDWAQRDPLYRQGLMKKWEKDMRRNAEQAEIEIDVFEKRYGQ